MKGFLPWLGGKSLLADRIVPEIQAVPHHTYVELFAGAGHVFFRIEKPARTEVLNDINGDLVTLYRVVKHHLDEFIRYFRWELVSREEFKRLQDAPPHTLTDIQRAARFYYLQRTAFGGKIVGQTFGTGIKHAPRLNLLRIEEDLSAAHLRLARATIENLAWEECLPRYDSPETRFYVDPPYFGNEEDYGRGIFKREDFQRLAEALQGIQGTFVVSLNDRPEVRKIFQWAKLTPVKTRYSVSKGRSQQIGELLITPKRAA